MNIIPPEPLMPMPKKVVQDIKKFIESTELTKAQLEHFEHMSKRTLVLKSHLEAMYEAMEKLKR